MRKSLKNVVTLTLAAAMVLGSTMTAFADGGGTTGTGSSTGHVNTEILNVVYPTIDGDATPFAYIMDSERLIRTTGKYKNASVTLTPNEDSDTGVYFTTSTSTFNNTSTALNVVNKSSMAVDVSATVKASVESGSTMVDLAESSDVSSTDLELYLGLKVGDDEKAVTADDGGVTATATVAGCPENYEYTSLDTGLYSYAMKDTADDTKWAKTTISMTGAVSAVDNTDSKAAPTLAVTWTAAKAAASATGEDETSSYTVTGATISDAGKITPASDATNTVITFNSNVSKIEFSNDGTAYTEFGAASTNVVKSGKTLTILNSYINGKPAAFKLRVTLEDESEFVFTK